MGSLKNAIAIAGALVPIAYFGWLLYYFYGVGGSVEGVAAIGLGPTVLGLGAVCLLFCIPLVVRMLRIAAPPRSTDGVGAKSRDEPEESFDADAAFACYMARKTVPAAAPASDLPISPVAPARPQGFGRKLS